MARRYVQLELRNKKLAKHPNCRRWLKAMEKIVNEELDKSLAKHSWFGKKLIVKSGNQSSR